MTDETVVPDRTRALLERLLRVRAYVADVRDRLEEEVGTGGGPHADPGDAGAEAYGREVEADLLGEEQAELRAIDEALRRVREGTFGRCEECGADIGAERLDLVPWTRYCVACESEIERSLPAR